MSKEDLTVIVWRDKFDREIFSIGTKHAHGTVIKWIDLWAEAVNVVFGEDVSRSLDKLTPGGEPVEVTLTLTFGDAESKLLVAAPDLLAACKAALFPAGDTPQQIRDQLLAAIRKAEGTQPATEAGR